MRFCQLHVHTDHSFLDGVGRADEYAELAARNGHPAIACTDHGQLHGLPAMRRACKARNLKFIPGCLLAGQEIVTSRGVVPVEQIQVGDLVLTHQGRFCRVLRTMSRKHIGPLYDIIPAGRTRAVTMTGEHPVLVRDERGRVGWVRADMVPYGRRTSRRGKDAWSGYVCLPKPSGGNGAVDLARYIPPKYRVASTGIVRTSLLAHRGEAVHEWDLSGFQRIDPDLAYFLGLFAAEGSVRHVGRSKINGDISLCFGAHERYPEVVRDFLLSRFQINARIDYRSHKGTAEVNFCCVPMAHVLSGMFGHTAKNKRVPLEVFQSSRQSQKRFLDGLWDGDATAKVGGQRRLKVASPHLAWGAKSLLAGTGTWSGVGKIVGGNKVAYQVCWSEDRAYSRTLEDEKYLYRPIQSVQRHQPRRPVKVYNFAVEGDESYVSDFVLHNCELYVNDEREKSAEAFAEARRQQKAQAGSTKGSKKLLDPTFTDNHLVILAANQIGWRNMLAINHDSVRNGFYYKPRSKHDIVCGRAEGLIATTACLGSIFSRLALAKDFPKLRAMLAQFKDAFQGRFFYEVHINESPEQKVVNAILSTECDKFKIEPLLTCDVHYACQDDVNRQDEMIATSRHTLVSDPDGFALSARELWFNNPRDAMLAARKWGYGLDKMYLARAASNTALVADMCDADIYGDGTLRPPLYLDDHGHPPADPDVLLTKMTRDGFFARGLNTIPEAGLYRQQARHELAVIRKLGMADFYLVTWDIVRECKKRGIMVWTRGSGCASLVAALVGITPLDPLRFGLLFERFVDPERPNAPDFDLDIDASRRHEVVEWLYQKYGGPGGERIARICAFQTFGLKAALRDVLKSRGVDISIAARLAAVTDDMKPAVGFPVAQAEEDLSRCSVEKRPEVIEAAVSELREVCREDLQSWIDTHRPMLDGALTMVGRARGRTLHAAGFVVAPDALVNHLPIDRAIDPDTKLPLVTTAWTEGQATQDIADTGLMKIDLLRLETVAVVALCVKAATARYGRDVSAEIDPWHMDYTDPKVLAEFASGDGFGLHQMQEMGQHMARFVQSMKPQSADDIVAAIAAFRPGSNEHLDSFIARGDGREPVPQVHPAYDEITAETRGILIYQEQVMRVLNRLGDIPLRAAYKVIKAISKKKGDDIEKARAEFMAGASTKISEGQAKVIFDDVMMSAGYSFNKAHSASYGVLSWITAYLRAYYPLEFWWAWLCRTENKAQSAKSKSPERKIEVMMRRAAAHNLNLVAPMVGLSGSRWEITPTGKLLAPLSLIVGVGDNAADVIQEAYKAKPWTTLWEFMDWAEGHGRVVNARGIKAMAMAGALRAYANQIEAVDAARAFAEAKSSSTRTRCEAAQRFLASDQFPKTIPSEEVAAELERQSVGFCFWRNPWRAKGRDLKVAAMEDAGRLAVDGEAHVHGKRRAFLLSSIKKHRDKKQRDMAFVSMLSRTGQSVSGVVFSSVWKNCSHTAVPGKVYLVRGEFDGQGKYMVGGDNPFVDLDSVS